MFKKSSLEDYFHNSRTALTNARDNQRIYSLISAYNFDTAKLEQGLTLLDRLVAADKAKTDSHGLQLVARRTMLKLLEETHPVYMEHANFAKLHSRTNTARLSRMILFTPKESNVNNWLRQTDTFYTNIFLDPDLLASLESSTITAEKLTANYEKVKTITAASIKYQETIGLAQTATAARNKLIEEFNFFMKEFIFVCRVALKNEPQLLEILKITVLSAGYFRKKKTTPIPGGETTILKDQLTVKSVEAVNANGVMTDNIAA